MTRRRQRSGRLAAALAVLGVVAFPAARASASTQASAVSRAGTSAAAAAAAPLTSISGAGSSWSAVLLDQWATTVATSDQLTVNFQPNGSAQGRTLYRQGQLDFAASDPPFRSGRDNLDPSGRESELPVSYGYSYVPDTAGGTAFMYHLNVGGHLITNLRLSGQTLTKIFTGQITNWDDPAITHDYGATLPSKPIIPVVRSDGSGATFFLTRWMASQYPAEWNAFCSQHHSGISGNCGPTEFYPTAGWGHVQAENGSTNVATFITSSFADGAIGYDEYAYAKSQNYPVVAMLNPAGYYVLPTASNVAVALTKAQIVSNPGDPNFLQQNLDQVYTFTDKRSYPLSSYSYLIVPRDNGPQPTVFKNNPGEGRSLSTFIDYFLCGGQQLTAQLGYSPLPLNLVKGALQQVDHIPGHGPTPNPTTLAGCNNPTFSNGVLTVLKNAPYPTSCQKAGAPLTCGGGTQPTSGTSSSPSPGTGSSKSPGTGSSSGTSSGSGSQSGSGSANPATGAAGNPATGGGTGTTGTATSNVTGQVVNLAADSASQPVLGALTAAAIVVAVAAPPTLAIWLRRRRGRAPG